MVGERGFATQTYPKITVTTRAAGWMLQRYIESARPASSANLRSYTTPRDATQLQAQLCSSSDAPPLMSRKP